jgi:hypothetical protein
MKKSKPAKTIPFDFVLERIDRLKPIAKPMFGCFAVYSDEKMLLILRKKEGGDPDNGVWVATTPEHHQSLRNEFKSLRSIRLFGEKDSSWQNLPEEADDFEESVSKICDLILKGDQRIGKIPKSKKKRKT